MKLEAIYVEWVDSVSVDAWEALGEAKTQEPHMIKTIGWLIEKRKKHLKVALNFDAAGDATSQYITIPISAIKKTRPIKLSL